MSYGVNHPHKLGSFLSFADSPWTAGLSIWMLPVPIFLTVLVGLVIKGLYNVYFHPLSTIPGPFLSTFTEVVYLWNWVKGDVIRYTYDLHRTYGKTVRIAPNRISFVDPEVWKELYGYKYGARKASLVQDPQIYGPESNGRLSLLSTFDDERHKTLRKVFQPGFSDRALKAQEHIIRTHVDKLVRNVNRSIVSDPENPIDFVRILNCVTFDIIGELAFGESLGLLDDGKMYGWIDSINESLIILPFVTLASRFPFLVRLITMMIPKRIQQSRDENIKYATELVEKRLGKGRVTEKPDIWSLVLNNQDSEILDEEDMKANATFFMGAGSETTATMLSGLMYFLLCNPDKFEKLLQEVRSSFTTEEELTIENIQRLKYLAACFDESMRPKFSEPLARQYLTNRALVYLLEQVM